ncbi:vitamin K epoxide reductase family protein [Cellulosimicrobium marinum]|uniref:vitamin K epoxide reductase family protein n=1 Tax=Cellulosimicrobium marinum TaxID=1638992 RepID=UPI001E2921DF|nr:vitamin K epoxide reductase family protein [Cellulosimicrobium marinum]MCB7135387.1 vitamin K epoxide reductase family protein [Cellulosimicrobium marinum]
MSKSATAGATNETGHDEADLPEPGEPRPISARTMGWLLVVLGAIGFLASADLTIERYLTLVDPDHALSCTLSVFVDCGPAMGSWQGSLLGFPNPLLGIAGFSVVITSGVVVLAGARLPRWYWLALLGGTTLALALVVFLVWTSLYALVRLCPWCMVVWAVVLPLFWYQVVHAVQEGWLPASAGVRRTLVRNRHLFLAIGYVALVAWVLLVMGQYIVSSL